jgi:hypothetical protein
MHIEIVRGTCLGSAMNWLQKKTVNVMDGETFLSKAWCFDSRNWSKLSKWYIQRESELGHFEAMVRMMNKIVGPIMYLWVWFLHLEKKTDLLFSAM